MGTTLTGTTPQDTYDSLIKVTDNGPLSGSLKVLTDGLGNDSALALSTGAASITGTLAVSGAVTTGTNTNVQATSTNTRLLVTAAGVANTVLGFNNSGSTENGVVNNAGYIGILQDYPLVVTIADGERMRITNTGNVGIGTSSPSGKLQVKGAIHIERDVTTDFSIIDNDGNLNFKAASGGVGGNFNMTFQTAASERMRISSDGYVRLSSSSGGLQFNGDTAAANALDDYEEGTWTMGVAFGGASVGVTTSANTGSYTKIGRQVTVNGFLQLSSKGSSSGNATITGLPFTVGSSTANYSSVSLRFENISFANQFQGFADINTTKIDLNEITILGVLSSLSDADFANNSNILLSVTYFV